ncbi:MAG: winged helix-turn-helix transcriptional regulator [Anaerolineales bacterium]|nr:winged helix-turn-helix transcriptional regulator [Anaerolineales bacterium]
MLKPLFGSEVREKVLIFLVARGSGYPTEIAAFFNVSLRQIQNQLDLLESGSVLASQLIGKTRIYEFNPRYAFLGELKTLLEKALSFYPKEIQESLKTNRRKPRRRNKPL